MSIVSLLVFLKWCQELSKPAKARSFCKLSVFRPIVKRDYTTIDLGETDMPAIGEITLLAQMLRCSLECELECGFSIWSEYDQWQLLSEHNETDETGYETNGLILDILNGQIIGQKAETFALPDDRQLLVVPVGVPPSFRLMVVGIVGPHASRVLRALADASLASLTQIQ